MTQPQSNGNSVMVQGRIVWVLGNLFTGRQKQDQQTKALQFDQQGNAIIEYGFGLAIPKIDPRTGQHTQQYVEIYQALYKEALTLFPSGQVPPTFSLKYKDGDVDFDDKGVPYRNREGYEGHIVLACTTRIQPKFFRYEAPNNILVMDGISSGDYVNVQLQLKAHPASGTYKAGLYVNPSAVQLITKGKEIVNAPSGDQLFGQNAPAYSGQVQAPTAPQMPGVGQPPAAPGYPGQPAPVGPPPGYPGQAPQQPHDPHYGVLPGQFQPQAPQQPVAPPGYPGQPAPMGPPPGYPQQPPAAPGYPQAPQQPAYPQQGQPGMPGLPPR